MGGEVAPAPPLGRLSPPPQREWVVIASGARGLWPFLAAAENQEPPRGRRLRGAVPAMTDRSPSGSRAGRLSLHIDTLISIRFMAQRMRRANRRYGRTGCPWSASSMQCVASNRNSRSSASAPMTDPHGATLVRVGRMLDRPPLPSRPPPKQFPRMGKLVDRSDAGGEKSAHAGRNLPDHGARSRLYRQRIKAGVAFG
jgi:hypothetical protein